MNWLTRRVVSFWLVTLALAFHGLSFRCDAQIITLVNNNSVAQVNTASQAGMFNWLIDNRNVLNQQWFWYRVGSLGPEASIDTISAPSITTPNARTLYTRYNN